MISLGIVSMFTDISSESVSAILPLYITGVLGLSTVAYGVLDGLYQGVSALVRIAAGFVADRVDRPKWVAFTGYALAAIARIGLLFPVGFGGLTAVITADRLGKGIRTAPRDALITASSDPRSLAASFGVHRALDNTGAAIGPILAFLVLLAIPNGFSTVFVISLAFAVVGVAILGLIVPNRRLRPISVGAEPAAEAIAATTTPPRRLRRSDLNHPGVRRLLAAAGVFGLLTIGDGFVYLSLQSRSDLAAQWFPLLFVGTNVAFLILAVPMGRLADRIGRARVFVLGHVFLLAAYLSAALPFTQSWLAILTLVLLGAFYAGTDGILSVLAVQFTPVEARATGIAAAQTVVALTRFVAAAGFGVLWFALGRAEALVVVSFALAAAIPLVALIFRSARRFRLDV